MTLSFCYQSRFKNVFSFKYLSRYSTNEYLYGKNPVHLALLARARKCHRLFVQCDRHQTVMEPRLQKCIELAQGLSIPVQYHENLDILCPDKPHQNIVLETRPLIFQEAAGLAHAATWHDSFRLKLMGYGKNENFTIPRPFYAPAAYESHTMIQRQPPLCLFLDGILDPQNLGAMIRSAYYFGVDALILEERGTSPSSSPTVSKASAGALELYGGAQGRIIYTRSASTFLKQSLENGWRLVGTLPPAPVSDSDSNANVITGSPILDYRSFTLEAPTLLLLGSEGKGIRQKLLKLCQMFLSISAPDHQGSEMFPEMDSLNVSVSLGILLAQMKRHRK